MTKEINFKRIGLTGGIGTGKTFVCNIFHLMGIPIYNADNASKRLAQSDSIKQKIKDLLGRQAYSDEGQYQTKVVAKLVFNDSKLLNQLNEILHPAVHHDVQEWFEQKEIEGFYYAIEEASLLFESGGNKGMDKIIVVDAPLDIRLNRIIKRDNIAADQILLRIQRQWDQSYKLSKADFIINNDGFQSVIYQVKTIHQKLVEMTFVSS